MKNGHEEEPLELSGLYADRTPSPGLEQRVIAEYKAALGEGRRGPRRDRRPRPGYMIAAALLLFLGGLGLGRLLPRGAPDEAAAAGESVSDERRAFMLVLWDNPAAAADAPPERVAEEYAAWARATAGHGVVIAGNELAPERIALGPGPQAAAAPPSEFRLGGYFIIRAPDADAARVIAEGHPHLARGGWIEVAELLH